MRVEGVDYSPFEGVKVYAFDGTTYKGYSGTSGKDGQVTFTLPQGNYRFRGDLNGTQFWSSAENACTLPGCAGAAITLPGGNTSRSAVTINYTYDGLSRLTAADYSSGDYYHYVYDSVGNRLTETTAKGETTYTYDPANRLTSVNGQAVQWDDNGNMLADGQAVYTYNTANKLVGVTKGTSSIVYAYSGLGDRLKQIADGVTTDYTLDINAGLTQVLQDNTNKYIYGNSRIAQIAETQTGYFLPDALGSMRQMTDPSADLTLARSYDPYGNVVSSSGAGETVYGYTGEMQSGGLVHLRARDYASDTGKFITKDTWHGSFIRPLSLNRWVYVEGNPITRTDPSGYEQIITPEIVTIWDYDNLPWGPDGYMDPRDLPTALLFSYKYTELDLKVYQLPRLKGRFHRNASRAFLGYYEVIIDYGRYDNGGHPYFVGGLQELKEMDENALQMKRWNWGKAGISAVADAIVVGKIVVLVKAGGSLIKVGSSVCMEIFDPRIQNLDDLPGAANSTISVGEAVTSGKPIGESLLDLFKSSVPILGTGIAVDDALKYSYPYQFEEEEKYGLLRKEDIRDRE